MSSHAWAFVVGVVFAFELTGSAAAGSQLKHKVQVSGNGAVTVVFEAGLGDGLESWSKIQREIGRSCTRTFSYSRLGYPGSDRPGAMRDPSTVVGELTEELARQRIAPPYVLVGHSLGGLYMQHFARASPEDIKGMVLVDATHWEHLNRIEQRLPALRRVIGALSLLMRPIMKAELKGSEQAEAPVIGTASVPTIVLSSTRASPGETGAFRHLMRELQTEVAAAHATISHQFVAGAGHYIHRDRPEVVLNAIRAVTGCDATAEQ